MGEFILQFNNREIAITIWTVIALILILFSKLLRKDILGIFKQFFSPKIFIPIFLMGIYCSVITYLFFLLHIWDSSMLKEFIFWFFISGISAMMNANTIKIFSLKKIFIQSFNITVIVEYIANIHDFSFLIELLLLPILLFFSVMLSFSSQKEEHKKVGNFFQFLLISYGIFLIYLSVQDVLLLENFEKIILMKLFIYLFFISIFFQFAIYLFAVFMRYETLFVNINFFMKEREKLSRKLKFKIFLRYLLDLQKINEKAFKMKFYSASKIKDENDIERFLNGKLDDNF